MKRENNVTVICVQLSKQKDLFRRYGHVIELDGTYRTNMQGMPLYTLLVEDNYDVGKPICYMWIKQETTKFIKSALQIFAEVNNIKS